ATVAMLDTARSSVSTALVDCGNRAEIESWAATITSENDRLDFLFNNAGVAYGAAFRDASLDNFEWLMNINYWGVVWCTKALLPLLEASPSGHLVNISSIFGMVGIATQSAYNSAKFAVRGFTESLQAEYRGTSLTVTCVHPGGIATNIALRARTDGEASKASAEERDESFKQIARTSATKAAQVIMKGTLAGRRRVFIGWDAWFMHTLTKFMPTSYHAITTRLGSRNDDNG
ncbi:MAG: SDR family NAD(P)-dependent oxidoreductase, partial [Luminiphilus sp.]